MNRAKRTAIAAMLRQHRLRVADEIAAAILEPQRASQGQPDMFQRERDAQAREDAATARRVGKWKP